MMNKVIIGILVVLVVLSGGLGTYSYRLGQQVEALSDELAALRGEATNRLNTLEDVMGETRTQINALQGDVSGAMNRVGLVEDEIKDVAAELSRSLPNADKVYQEVRAATVRIGDGERLVGSGFIYDSAGHVVTAHHVVEVLSKVYVTLGDGRSSTATVVGSCEVSDVAVLALDKPLSVEPLTLADSARVRIGEPVVAIGSPFNLTETLTSGIVSQTNRFVQVTSDTTTRWVANLIQYDAPVNPGNSGGPLLNSKGEVIGLVIARVDPNRGEGVYYAVSSNKVKRVANQIIERGSFDYPWVGIEVTDLTPKMVQERALETTNGALVNGILPGSPAEGSEIKVDDVIVAVDSTAINNVGDLTSYLGEYKSPGETLSVTVLRQAVKMDVSLKIGKRPS